MQPVCREMWQLDYRMGRDEREGWIDEGDEEREIRGAEDRKSIKKIIIVSLFFSHYSLASKIHDTVLRHNPKLQYLDYSIKWPI